MTVTTRTDPAPNADRPGIRAILKPGWLAIIALGLLFAGACWFILAPWQFSRHTEREQQNAQIESAMAAPVVPVTDLLSRSAEPPPATEWRSVTATGTFVADEQVYVRLRQLNGQDMRELVVPFVLTDGTRVLVDRGYFPTLDLSAGLLPAPLPSGELTLTGRVSADQPDPSGRPAQQVGDRREVYGVDSATLLGPGGLIGFIQLTSSSPAVLTEIGVPNRDDGPFLSYALQWCVFGAVALLAVGFFAYREMTDPPAGSVPPAEVPTADPTTPGKRAKFDRSELYD